MPSADAGWTALGVVRALYDAWNRADFASSAGLLDPAVRWDTFKGGRKVEESADGVGTTMMSGGSGATWVFSAVNVDLLLAVGDHAIALCRRGTPVSERLEVWTVRNGRVVRFRGYPFEEGMTALSVTTGSHRVEGLARGVRALNRRDLAGWTALFRPEVDFRAARGGHWQGHDGIRRYVAEFDSIDARLDDMRILAESQHTLVVSGVQRTTGYADDPMHLVIAFQGDLVRWIMGYPTAEQALAAARAL